MMGSTSLDRMVSLDPTIVTGGCGPTGSHMVESVLKHEPTCEVHVIACNVRNEITGVTHQKCDISSLEQIQAVFKKVRPKTVFHMASPDSSLSRPAMFWKVNVGGT
jgi:sterol-4alpha-carboxylate 3-dehydrogenase (decarboxylating)